MLNSDVAVRSSGGVTMLDRHGTTLATLTPGAIIEAAKADMIRRNHNKRVMEGFRDAPVQWFSFDRKHVTAASDWRDLIQRAHQHGPYEGFKRSCHLIYATDALRAAADAVRLVS